MGFAFDQYGRIGADARGVVARLVVAGELASGAHPDDLRRELLAQFGAAVAYAMASRYARAAGINKDTSMGAPRWASLSKRSGLPRGGGGARCGAARDL